MNVLNDITDDEFIPFLESLGAETYKKSFEWMLNDQDFAGVLSWLFQNLDHNNALSAREEYRYAELEKRGQLLSLEELEASIANLHKEYDGLCLPGDKDAEEDVKTDINMQKERLAMLEKQEETIQELVKQNELTKEELCLEVTKLHSAHQQCVEDEEAAANECLQLADEVEGIMEEVVDVVANTLDLYSNSSGDKDIARKFLTFGPFDSYRQTQALYRSHFDLYTSKMFNTRQKGTVTDDELRSALVEAKSMEDRLSDAALAYIESKAELSGEQAKLALVANYTNVHPSQISACLMEAQSALGLLEQEESILDQQIQDSVKDFVTSRTRLAVEATAQSALAVRERLRGGLARLLRHARRARRLDGALRAALHAELRAARAAAHFAARLRRYVVADRGAVADRIDSMNQICAEQDVSIQSIQSSNLLTQAFAAILDAPHTNDAATLVKIHADLLLAVKGLEDDISEGFKAKETAVLDFNKTTQPMVDYIYDGCTRRPHCWDKVVASLSHSLKHHMERVEKKVVEASSRFNTVKNGDKHHLRKLWQWFLTDPGRLQAALKDVQEKSYL